MRILFRELFTISLTHGFYGGACPDLHLTLPADTRRGLANARLLARERGGVLHLLYEADDAGMPLVRAPGARLRFVLRLVNPSFPNYTQLPADFPARLLAYENAPDPAELQAGLGAPVGGPELSEPGAVGVVEIRVDDAFYGAPPAFQIAFHPREEPLRYYLVARGYTQADLDSLDVADLGFAEEGRPEIVFDRVPQESFTSEELAPTLLAASGEPLVLFRSRSALARRARARRRIQLSRRGDVLIANLPQPGVDRASADLIIHLSKP